MAEKDGLRKLIPLDQLVSSSTEVRSQRVDMQAVRVSPSELEISREIVRCFEDYRRNHPDEAQRENCPSPVDLICDSLIENRGIQPIELTIEQSRASQPGLVLASAPDTEETRVSAQSIILVRPVHSSADEPRQLTTSQTEASYSNQAVPFNQAPANSADSQPISRRFFLRAIYQQGLQAYQLIESNLDKGQLEQPLSGEPQPPVETPADPEFAAQQQAALEIFIRTKAA